MNIRIRFQTFLSGYAIKTIKFYVFAIDGDSTINSSDRSTGHFDMQMSDRLLDTKLRETETKALLVLLSTYSDVPLYRTNIFYIKQS